MKPRTFPKGEAGNLVCPACSQAQWQHLKAPAVEVKLKRCRNLASQIQRRQAGGTGRWSLTLPQLWETPRGHGAAYRTMGLTPRPGHPVTQDTRTPRDPGQGL